MSCTPANGAAAAASITRSRSRRGTSGASRRGSCGPFTRGSTSHDPCALGRSASVLPAVRPVRALSHDAAAQPLEPRGLERRDRLARDRRARVRDRSAALHRGYGRTADERLRAAAHGERAARAGPVPVTTEPGRRALAALLRRPALARLLAALDGAGEEARIVGGAVRNALIGRPVTEIDVATTATPQVVAARAREAGIKAVPTGLDHGTLTLVIDGTP